MCIFYRRPLPTSHFYTFSLSRSSFTNIHTHIRITYRQDLTYYRSIICSTQSILMTRYLGGGGVIWFIFTFLSKFEMTSYLLRKWTNLSYSQLQEIVFFSLTIFNIWLVIGSIYDTVCLSVVLWVGWSVCQYFHFKSEHLFNLLYWSVEIETETPA